jgi:hypothetical protein
MMLRSEGITAAPKPFTEVLKTVFSKGNYRVEEG